MAAIEAGLRGGGIAILLLLAFLGWRDGRRPAACYGILFMLSAAAYLIESAPGLAVIQPPWIVPLRLMSATAPALFQLWISAMFDDSFRPSWRHWLPTMGMLALAGWAMAAHRWLPWRLVEAAALLLVVVGILSERDIVEALGRYGGELLGVSVGEVMASPVVTCDPGDSVAELMAEMTSRRIRHFPVVDNGRLAGIVSIGDLVKSRLEEIEHEAHSMRSFIAGAA